MEILYPYFHYYEFHCCEYNIVSAFDSLFGAVHTFLNFEYKDITLKQYKHDKKEVASHYHNSVIKLKVILTLKEYASLQCRQTHDKQLAQQFHTNHVRNAVGLMHVCTYWSNWYCITFMHCSWYTCTIVLCVHVIVDPSLLGKMASTVRTLWGDKAGTKDASCQSSPRLQTQASRHVRLAAVQEEEGGEKEAVLCGRSTLQDGSSSIVSLHTYTQCFVRVYMTCTMQYMYTSCHGTYACVINALM